MTKDMSKLQFNKYVMFKDVGKNFGILDKGKETLDKVKKAVGVKQEEETKDQINKENLDKENENKAKEDLNKTTDSLKENIIYYGKEALSKGKDALSKGAELGKDALHKGAELGKEAIDKVKTATGYTKEEIKDEIKEDANKAYNLGKEAKDEIKEGASKAYQKGKEIKDEIKEGAKEAYQYGKEHKQDIKEDIKEGASKAYEYGKDALNKGAELGKEALEKGAEVGKEAYQKVKATAGFGSEKDAFTLKKDQDRTFKEDAADKNLKKDIDNFNKDFSKSVDEKKGSASETYKKIYDKKADDKTNKL